MIDSLFGRAAAGVTSGVSDIAINLSKIRVEELPNHPLYQAFLSKSTSVITLEVTLDKHQLTAVVMSTPEAEAVSGAGAFVPDKQGKLSFIFPRFHLGVPAQLDLAVATHHLAKTSIFQKILGDLSEKNSGIIYFSREGHLTQWQQAVFLATGKNLPTTLAEIHHTPADNEYSRIAVLSRSVNFEGFPQRNIQTIFLCDPVASGMQQVRMIEELAKVNRLPKEIVVIAPMASLWGLQVIAETCRLSGINCTAGVLGSLLDTTLPLHYYSPYPSASEKAANSKLHQFMSQTIGPELHRFCIRGNWTGSFWGGAKFPLDQSNLELAGLGLDNQKVRTLSKKITPDWAKKVGLFDSILPYSTKLALVSV